MDYRKWLELPVLPEAESFDWSLSYADLDVKYLPNSKRVKKKKTFNENYLYDPKNDKPIFIAVDDPFPLPALKKTPKFIEHKNRKCELYGYLNKTIGFGCQKGQPIYHDKEEDKLVLDYVGTRICYYVNSLKGFIDKISLSIAPVKSNIKVVPFKESGYNYDYIVEKIRNELEPNFH